MIQNKYKIIGLLLFSNLVFSQVSLGDELKNASAILDLSDITNPKGLVLPWVETLPSHENGSVLYDAKDKQVKYSNNGKWEILSEVGNVELLDQDKLVEKGEGVLISDVVGNAVASSEKAILNLESKDKALLLASLEDPSLVLENPEAGTIIYSSKYKCIFVFNGESWNFIKEPNLIKNKSLLVQPESIHLSSSGRVSGK